MLSAWQAFTTYMILIVILFAGGPMACACGKYSALVGTLAVSTYNAIIHYGMHFLYMMNCGKKS